jgi:hypothetical protein
MDFVCFYPEIFYHEGHSKHNNNWNEKEWLGWVNYINQT